MRKFRRVIKWFAASIAVVLVGAVLGAALYMRTENFQRWLRQEALSAVNGSIRGELSIERVDGSVWRHLTLHGVTLSYESREIARIPRLDLYFSLIPLLWSEVRIAAIDAAQPRLQLTQDRDGKWNLVEALAPRQPEPPSNSALAVIVNALRLSDGVLELQLANADTVYRFDKLSLDGSAAIRPAGLNVGLDSLSAGLVAPGQPAVNLKGAVEYRQDGAQPAVLKLKNVWAVSRASQVKLNGQVETGEKIKINAQAALNKLAPADIAFFVTDWPIKRDLTGNLAVEGALDGLQGKVQLAAAGAQLSGGFTADVMADQPKYSAALKLSELDLHQWLNGNNVAGILSGEVQAAGNGFSLQAATGKAKVQIRAAQAQGWALGAASMEASLERGAATVDGRLNGKLGAADWTGKIILTDKRPSYDLNFSVKDFDVQKSLANTKAMEGKLNLQGSVKGAGLQLADMDARAELRVMPSSLGPVAIQKGELSAALTKQKIRIARANLSATDATLSARGELGIAAAVNGNLDYRVQVGNLSPWLALVDRKGGGALDLNGQASGSLADVQSRGTAKLTAVRLDSSAVKSGNLKFALQRQERRALPIGTVNGQFEAVDAGVALRRVDIAINLPREPAETMQLDVNARDQRDRRHGLVAAVNFDGNAIVARLSQATLTAPDGAWKLAAPATVSRRDEAFVIERLALRNGDREIALDGRFAFSGNQDLNLNIERLPLDALAAFMADPPKMTGLLAAKARISGTAAAPELTAAARLSDASFAGQTYDGATADVAYQNRKTSLRLTVQQDATHVLNGSGTVPLNLSWSDGWRADFADGMDLRLQSSGVSLAFLNAFSGKAAQNIAGELSLDISARGSVKQPELRGSFSLRDGKLKAVPLGVDIQTIAAAGDLDARNLNLRDFSARAKDGEIRGSGSLALKNYDIGAVKVMLTARRWPAIETARYQVKIDGNIGVEGAVSAPKVKGQITVTEGSLRPDLAFLEQSKVPTKRDETIVIVKSNGAGGQPQTPPQPNRASDNDLVKAMEIDLQVKAPGNLWIRHPDLVSELSGNIHLVKAPKREIDLTGRIDVVRGWFGFQGRRFELESGAIQFTGGDKINPSLNILAHYRLPEYTVDAIISGTVEKPSLTLASQPRLEQADILALLIFGRPLNALSQNEQSTLQQSAIGITTGYVAGQIAKSVSSALGLDSLGVDIRQVDFSGGQVGFGRYIGNKTYVSVSQQLTGERGREVQLEYQIAPDWKLGTSTTSTGANGIDIIWQKRY